jgi:hypothetical protein
MNKLLASLAAVSLVAIATPAMAGGKKDAGPKTEKACTAKGGTWTKKGKKCKLPDAAAAATTTTTEEAAPAATTEEAAPAEGTEGQ